MKALPEKLAEQYADDKSKAYYIGENGEKKWYITTRGQHSKEDFLAGYQAAKDQLADASKVMKFNKGNNAEMEKVNMKFAYDSFPVTDQQVQDVKQIRESFSSLTDHLSQLVPNGRYLSLVQTKLEEACMFAVKGITHQAGDYDKLQNKA